MRRTTLNIIGGLFLMGGLSLTGCSAAHQTPAETGLSPDAKQASCAQTERQYAPARALALACDPMVTAPTPVLDRDVREAYAIGGFEDATTEYFDVQTDDDQSYYNFPNTYERRVISDRVGVIFH